ncbi:MAG: inositol monophosphatase [Clostridia bacterium]|nr:inositol monophosphatase [Clostridia bacterium]
MELLEKARLAERAARASGEMLERRGDFSVSRKSENDFVTQMDFKSEALIRDMLLTACPGDEFFGEEGGGAQQAAGRWIVDPIDGTANYMRNHRLYTISIAYEREGELAVGCVFCPGTNELFSAVRGHGATLNGRPIRVSGTSLLRDAFVHLGFGHRNPACLARTLARFPALMGAVSDVRRSGTAAYDLCCVADGRSDAFVELGLNLYDYAAGYVILTEAGGRLTGWQAGEDGIATGNILATNALLHEPLRRILCDTASQNLPARP